MSKPPFDPVHAARSVLRSTGSATLATLVADGGPFASLATTATDLDGTPLLLLSRLAIHTANLDRDARASLLLVAPGGEGGDPLAGSRLTLEGRAVRIGRDDPALARIRRRFLARRPEAEGYVDFTDFGFFRLEPARGHLVAGFGRIHAIAPDDLLVPAETAADFAEAEAGVLEHMNADHADALALYATALLGDVAGAWTAVGCDPDGLDLALDGRIRRLAFPERQAAVPGLRFALKALADSARAA